jgi:hypothetical protein
VFWYSEPSFSAGIAVTTIDGIPVRIYSPEKTVEYPTLLDFHRAASA